MEELVTFAVFREINRLTAVTVSAAKQQLPTHKKTRATPFNVEGPRGCCV